MMSGTQALIFSLPFLSTVAAVPDSEDDSWRALILYSVGSFVVILLVTLVVQGSISKMYQVSKPKEVPRSYFGSSKEADEYWLASGGKPQKSFSYGTVVYIPEESLTDFGPSAWPPKHLKKNVCPRIILVSTWTNSRLALPGGKGKGQESALDAINREFMEETGSSTNFDESNYAFSFVDEKKTNHYFVKFTRDESDFNSILRCFTDSSKRKAFVDEIFGSVEFPVWIEGPINAKAGTFWGDTQVWGLPRFLNSSSFREKDQLLILLAKAKVLNVRELERVFDLTNALKEDSLNSSYLKRVIQFLNWIVGETFDLPSFKDFIKTPGLSAILQKSSG